jgi:hypothetical protein
MLNNMNIQQELGEVRIIVRAQQSCALTSVLHLPEKRCIKFEQKRIAIIIIALFETSVPCYLDHKLS